MLRSGEGRHETTLAAAHEQKLVAGIGQALDIGNHCFQILNFRQHGHIRGCAVTLALHKAAAAEIEAVGSISQFRQGDGILPDGILECHKAMAHDSHRQILSLRSVLRAANGQIVPLAFKNGLGNTFL